MVLSALQKDANDIWITDMQICPDDFAEKTAFLSRL